MPATVRSARDSAYVLRLIDEMQKSRVDEVFTHEQVGLILSPDRFTKNQRYSLVQRAVKRLRDDRGMIFTTVRGEGYRRLNGVVGVNHIGGTSITKVHNVAYRGSQALGSALHHHGRHLSPIDSRTNSNRQATLGIVKYLTEHKTVEVLPESTEPYKPADPLSGLAGLRKILGL